MALANEPGRRVSRWQGNDGEGIVANTPGWQLPRGGGGLVSGIRPWGRGLWFAVAICLALGSCVGKVGTEPGLFVLPPTPQPGTSTPHIKSAASQDLPLNPSRGGGLIRPYRACDGRVAVVESPQHLSPEKLSPVLVLDDLSG